MRRKTVDEKQQREWKGLDEKDLMKLWINSIKNIGLERYKKIAAQVEQFLKEKNT